MVERNIRRTLMLLWIAAMPTVASSCDTAKAAETAPVQSRAVPERHVAKTTVVLHMTGMLLLVPNRISMDVLMPRHPGHKARLGFGFNLQMNLPTGLCDDSGFIDPKPTTKFICYVDLEKWSVDPIGSGGQPSPADVTVPRGVLNLTRLWQYYLGPTVHPGEARAKVKLVSGSAGETCRGARWKVRPFSSPGGPHPMVEDTFVNVLNWTVEDLDGLQLTFRRKGRAHVIQFPAADQIDLVLAHVRTGQLRELPPNDQMSSQTVSDVIADVEPYFGLVDRSPELQATHRRPSTPRHYQDCRISITRPAPLGDSVVAASPRTFSCMLATAER
jgi:hypothetical protein